MKYIKLPALIFCLILLSHFQPSFANEWKRAYLTSYPRSGNHWIRNLIEETSKIATGSVYCDKEPQHMKKIFPWGGYCCKHGYEGNCRYPNKHDLVLIKTHFPSQPNHVTKFDNRPYKLAIRIIRHPVDSFYSRYVRKPNGALQEKVPSYRIKEFIDTWREFQAYWDQKENVITIKYEDVLENPFIELKKMLIALKYDVTDEDILRAIAKHPPEGFMLKSRDKFTNEDLNLISSELGDLLTQFNYSINF